MAEGEGISDGQKVVVVLAGIVGISAFAYLAPPKPTTESAQTAHEPASATGSACADGAPMRDTIVERIDQQGVWVRGQLWYQLRPDQKRVFIAYANMCLGKSRVRDSSGHTVGKWSPRSGAEVVN